MRIETHMTRLSAAYDDAVAGGIVRPSSLRPYGWCLDDVAAFWRSVRLGIPVGSMTVWRPSGAIGVAGTATGRLGPVAAPPARHAALLLDGYARLATIAWTLRRPGAPVPAALDVAETVNWSGRLGAFDPGTGGFVTARPDGDNCDGLLPGHAIADARAMLCWERGDADDRDASSAGMRRDLANAMAHAWAGATVVVHTVHSGDPAAVRDAMMAMGRPGGRGKGWAGFAEAYA